MDYASVKKAISGFGEKRVAVIGDVMLDQYTFGSVTRISPEAPIQVVKKTGESFTLGGAANVANNVASLGARAVLCGVVGSDNQGKSFMNLIGKQGIDGSGIFVHDTKPTIVKHRVVSGGHQLLRVDEEDDSRFDADTENKIFSKIEPAVKESDIVVLSDYAKGIFSQNLTSRIISLAKTSGKKVIADLKPQNKESFVGVDLAVPNAKEAEEMTGSSSFEESGPALVKHFDADVIIKRGGEGMTVFRKDKKSTHVPAKKIKIFDVSGAGDTVMAVLALGLSSGMDLETSAVLANAAGGVVVQKPGTATLTAEELISAFGPGSHTEGLDVVPKVWGYEKWLENNDKYCCKLLSLNKGYQCSLHYHKNKDEMFLVTKGHVRLEMAHEVLHLREGDFVRLKPETIHRFTGLEDSVIVEVSTHHEEDDSYRLEGSRKAEFS